MLKFTFLRHKGEPLKSNLSTKWLSDTDCLVYKGSQMISEHLHLKSHMTVMKNWLLSVIQIRCPHIPLYLEENLVMLVPV